MKHFILDKLQTELTAFGLNPAHWVILLIQDRQVHIQHKEDKEVLLQGQFEIQQTQVVWTSLEWAV